MTTRDFIAKTYNTTATRERFCSSVFTDYDGNVYSYGYHYPLAFHVAGLDFVNNQGYSSSTSKHIGWAQSAIGYGNYINVKLWREDSQALKYATDQEKLDVIVTALERELASVQKEMSEKVRKDTRVYSHLKDQEDYICNSLNKVYGAQA